MTTKLIPLEGKIFLKVEREGDSITFLSIEGEMFDLSASDGPPNDVQVFIESVVGDLEDLVGVPMLMAEEESNEGNGLDPQFTWTFYKFATIKGYVDIRFCGQSNGYYSEKATLSSMGKRDISKLLAKFESEKLKEETSPLQNKKIKIL